MKLDLILNMAILEDASDINISSEQYLAMRINRDIKIFPNAENSIFFLIAIQSSSSKYNPQLSIFNYQLRINDGVAAARYLSPI